MEFRFFGWAHTRGDGFVYLPKERVLCTGDAVVNGPYNFTADGNIGNWPKVVEAAMKLDVDHVLPGHGPAGGKDVMAGQRAFMLELHKAVAAAIQRRQEAGRCSADRRRKIHYYHSTFLSRQELGGRWISRPGEGRLQRNHHQETHRRFAALDLRLSSNRNHRCLW